jgi:uncharacterized membrane protein HdeD (DUF308 family)
MANFLLLMILIALVGMAGPVALAVGSLILALVIGAFLLVAGVPPLIHHVYALSGLPLIDHQWWFVYTLIGSCGLLYLFWPRRPQPPIRTFPRPRSRPARAA